MGRYSNRFVLCILVDGQVQKDLANGEVHLPFGAEYVVRLINKNDRRAVADLYVDGENVGSFVVKAHDRLDVRRSAHKDAAFKFVDLESPEAYGEGKQGPNPDKIKGLVEVRFRMEKEKPAVPKVEHIHHHHYTLPVPPSPKPWRDRPWWDKPWYESPVVWTTNTVDNIRHSSVRCTNNTGTMSYGPDAMNSMDCCSSVASSVDAGAFIPATSFFAAPTPVEEGCTVEGSKTGQRFVDATVDTEETETVLQLFLKGYHLQQTVRPSVVANAPQANPSKFCTECGVSRSGDAKFCGNCGNRF